ncbi:MAG: sodium:solute symporter family protein [Holosporaceae bacterium]|jgi:Na+/proline symporter|nr:sodium:solute symporter family protein [Holosporaceae bacterium]
MSDRVVITLYLITSVIVGYFAGKNVRTSKDFVLTGGNFTTFTMVALMFPMMIGCGDLFGGTDRIHKVGIIFLISNLGLSIQALCFTFITKALKNFKQASFPGDIMKTMYGENGQKIFGICTCVRSFGDTMVQFAAIGYICNILFGIDSAYILVICFVVTFYCTCGGIKALAATNIFQLLIFVIAFPIVSSIVSHKSGGLKNIINHISPEHLRILDHPDFMKYILIFLGNALPTDVGVMHRIIVAKNIKQANTVLKISALLYIPLVVFLALLGSCSLTVLENMPQRGVFSQLLNVTSPFGFRGIAAAGMIAVSMSAAGTHLNVFAISFTRDVIKPFLRLSSLQDKMELLIMKIVTVIFGIVASLFSLAFGNIADYSEFFDNAFPIIVFPSLFLGLVGFLFSKKVFLIGVSFSSCTFLILIILSSFSDDGLLLFCIFMIVVLNASIMYLLHRYEHRKRKPATS